MDSELESKIKEIGGMFGFTDLPDNLGDIVEAFVGSQTPSNDADKTADECAALPPPVNNKSDSIDDENDMFGLNLDMGEIIALISKFKTLQDKNKNDKKVKLLSSLKPFLNEKRKEKVGNCIKFMSLAEIAGSGFISGKK